MFRNLTREKCIDKLSFLDNEKLKLLVSNKLKFSIQDHLKQQKQLKLNIIYSKGAANEIMYNRCNFQDENIFSLWNSKNHYVIVVQSIVSKNPISIILLMIIDALHKTSL